MKGRAAFDEKLAETRAALVEHVLFRRVTGAIELRAFMEAHVFAVWDFMCLLKTLQRALTGTEVPWFPPADRDAARFLNEIVLGEESDEIAPGRYTSHFELYREAMRDCGASTDAIDRFLSLLQLGVSLEEALVSAPEPARDFVRSTLRFCARTPHEAAAAFLYGREDLVPDMFRRILAEAGALGLTESGRLRLYLERHVEIDGGSHGPMAARLMDRLCGNDEKKWAEAAATALEALEARLRLWDALFVSLNAS